MLWLNQEQVLATGIGNMSVAQPLVEEVFRLWGSDQLISAPEEPLRCRQVTTDEAFYSLPAFLGDKWQVAGIKWTTHHPDNRNKGLPHIYTLTTLNDPHTGCPLAVMEASEISAMRTGAVTATALKYLATPEARTLFCCGAGVQARRQLHAAVYALPNLERIYIWGRTRSKAEALLPELRQLRPNMEYIIADDISLVRTCDIVITATNAVEPYLDADDFKDGVLYCNIGFNETTPAGILSFDQVIFDDYQMGLANSTQAVFRLLRNKTFPPEKNGGLLTSIINGERCLRQMPGTKLMFDAFGLVVFDLVLAHYAYHNAIERGLGQELDLFGGVYGKDH